MCTNFGWKPNEKTARTLRNIPLTPLRRSGLILENNIKMDLKEIGSNDVDWTELSLRWSLLIVDCRINCNNGTYLMYHNVIARKVKVLALLDKLDSSISLPGVPDSTGNKTKHKPAYSCVCHASISIYITVEINIPPLFCIQQERWLLSVATVQSFIIVDRQ